MVGEFALVDHLSQKKLINMKCIVCGDLKEFEQQLKELPPNTKCCFIVRNPIEVKDKAGNVVGIRPHMTPLYVEKGEKETHVLVTDSLGEGLKNPEKNNAKSNSQSMEGSIRGSSSSHDETDAIFQSLGKVFCQR